MGGGNAANAAVCVSRLGLPTKIITKLGSDEIGSSVVKEFQYENVDTSYIRKERESGKRVGERNSGGGGGGDEWGVYFNKI